MYNGHRARVKKRFSESGINSFQDYEVLELLLFYSIPQGDVKPLAKELLDRFHTLRAVFDADDEALRQIKGVGEHTATLLRLVPQLSQLYLSLGSRNTRTIKTVDEAGRYVCDMIGARATEEFCVLCLDASYRLLAFECVEKGTVAQANVYPRKVVECAVRNKSVNVILAHNHPTGIMQASESDRQVTQKIYDILENIGIGLLDHIIAAGGNEFYSMGRNGILPEWKGIDIL